MDLLTVAGLILYFLPAMIANVRRKQNAGAIAVVNLLLGWTCLGWVIALVWAVTNDAPQPAAPQPAAPPPQAPRPIPVIRIPKLTPALEARQCAYHSLSGCDPDRTAREYAIYRGDEFIEMSDLCPKCHASLVRDGFRPIAPEKRPQL